MLNKTPFVRPQSASLMQDTSYNIILDADSYKVSHWLQYPKGSSALFSYIESRGGDYDIVLFFGLQYIMQQYLEIPIAQWMIDEAKDLITPHGLGQSFNEYGWKYIIDTYGGYLPVVIRAVPEGTVVRGKNVLVTIYCDDPKAFWVVSYIETLLLRVWAPTTTATKSFDIKQTIQYGYLVTSDLPIDNLFKLSQETGVPQALLFGFHDFGARGGSSLETVSICGAGHLVNFYGTDTLSALKLVKQHYGNPCAGYSIDASEHSTMTVLGPEGEFAQFDLMISQFGDRHAFACVSDGFNIYNAIKNGWGGALRDKVIAMNAMLIVRPDSGDPVGVPIECVILLADAFGTTTNSKGFKVLNHVRVIQGDGIGPEHVYEICAELIRHGYSTENMAFGMGGGLIQNQTRDTLKFACKNSWMMIDGEGVDVFKNPITDPGKKSKKGRMTLIETDGEFSTVTELTDEQFDDPSLLPGKEALVTVFDHGAVVKSYTMDEIRLTAESYLGK